MRRTPILCAVLFTTPLTSFAQATSRSDTTLQVAFGGFVDAYYAYDFGTPASLDRSFASGNLFTTQPARHNEFNVNLAYVEAMLSGDRVRGRLALQAGTSVQSNYSGEPANGVISGPTLARHIQEAYAGYQLSPSLWIDAGIFYSHMGLESWASRDNLTYSRSLIAEYSPYYSSGARVTFQASSRLTVRLDLVNGWQNISETNTDKGAGLRLDFAATLATTLTYYGFANSEVDGRLRVFNGVGAKSAITSRVTFLGAFDYGSIENIEGDDSNWWGFAAIGRVQTTPAVAVVARVERYDDEDQVNIATGAGFAAFKANGASLGLDWMPHSRFLWRTEARGFRGDERIFPDKEAAEASTLSAFVVSSLAITF